MLAGFFPPMENLIPLTVVGTQSLPASTGPAGVLKYGETPFSLKLMPNPGPNLILPLISAIVLLGLIGRAALLAPPYLAASRWHPTWRPSSSPSCCAACSPCHFGRCSSSLEGGHLYFLEEEVLCQLLQARLGAGDDPRGVAGLVPDALWACKTSTAAISLPFPKIRFHHQR